MSGNRVYDVGRVFTTLVIKLDKAISEPLELAVSPTLHLGPEVALSL